LYTISEAKVIF